MSRQRHFTPVTALATRPAAVTCAPLSTLTLLLTIGSLPLPTTDHCTG
jgi:hypothetical protein